MNGGLVMLTINLAAMWGRGWKLLPQHILEFFVWTHLSDPCDDAAATSGSSRSSDMTCWYGCSCCSRSSSYDSSNGSQSSSSTTNTTASITGNTSGKTILRNRWTMVKNCHGDRELRVKRTLLDCEATVTYAISTERAGDAWQRSTGSPMVTLQLQKCVVLKEKSKSRN